jgi:hypothetical protein
VLLGGGVEPSIDDTLRESIKYSFVSSEGAEEEEKEGGLSKGITSGNKDLQVMNRMNWITLLKVLFDELESFT